MLGAIAGDIIGSSYEWNNIRTTKFKLFTSSSTYTDDTVLSIAVAVCLLDKADYAITLKQYGRQYPNRGYGGRFKEWLDSGSLAPYNSFGNGSAMRAIPIGFAFDNIKDVLREATKSAEVTHNHPEGVKGARAVAVATFMARKWDSKEHIKKFIELSYGYNLSQSLDDLRLSNKFDETCQGTVPKAIIAFLESRSYIEAIRNAISIGGDSDTIACIAGGIAQAYYKVLPEYIVQKVKDTLPFALWDVVDAFNYKYNIGFTERGTLRTTRADYFMAPPQQFPSEMKQLKIAAAYTTEEYEHIMIGLIPMAMEDKWHIYWEDDWVYFHRSWTGHPVYKVHFGKFDEAYKIKEASVNRESGPFNDLENEEDAQMLKFLIDRLLLCKKCEAPGDGSGMAALQVFHEVGWARGNKENTF